MKIFKITIPYVVNDFYGNSTITKSEFYFDKEPNRETLIKFFFTKYKGSESDKQSITRYYFLLPPSREMDDYGKWMIMEISEINVDNL